MQVSGIRNSNLGQSVVFGRRPTRAEEPFVRDTMNRAYDFMGTKERAVITHGSCFPAYDRNTNIGSPYGNGAKEWLQFLALYGFNSNQLGPCGELEKGVNSPYKSSAFAKNRLFIDLKDLTGDKYGNLLSKETYNKVTKPLEITDKNYEMTDFEAADETYDIALKEVYKNFRKNLSKCQPQALALDREYRAFLKKNDGRLTDEGIFKVLSNEYGTDDYEQWSDLDHHLCSRIDSGNVDAVIRYKDLYKYNKNNIEQYKFEQFLVTKQIKENKEWREKLGVKYINDLLVGCSKMDAWRYEDAFLDDWEMGARENDKPSQRWGIKVLDPKKIFKNGRYELNIGGEFLKEKIEAALEFNEGIRVDHVMGLIEPYIMKKSAKDEDFFTYPPHNKNKNIEKYISELKNPANPYEEYDKYWDYPKLLEHLVLPLFESKGIHKEDAVWEDVCTYPDRFKQVYSKLQLPRITNIDWERAEDAINEGALNNWFVISTHDQGATMNYLKRIGDLKNGTKGEYTRESSPWNVDYLAGYLNMDDSRANIAKIREELKNLYLNNDREWTFAKFSELLTAPKFQISHDDLLGITDESAVYNVPGTTNDTNWKERISPDFLDKYYENLSSDNPTALNMPERVKEALQAKIDMQVRAHNYDSEFKEEIYEKAQPILDDLDTIIGILKEKEPA